MKKFIIGVIVLVPQMLLAGTDCWYKEFPNHYLAICEGDEPYFPSPERAVPSVASGNANPEARGQESSTSASPAYTAAASLPAALAGKGQQFTAAAETAAPPATGGQGTPFPATGGRTQVAGGRVPYDRSRPSVYRAPRSLLNSNNMVTTAITGGK